MAENTPTYWVNVYYDILDDDYCLWTIYRFTSKEIAEDFIKDVPFICSEVECNSYTRPIDNEDVNDKFPFRPIFSNLEDALADAKEFHRLGKDKEYKYNCRVFEVDLSEIEKQHDKNLIRDLRKENDELRATIEELRALKAT